MRRRSLRSTTTSSGPPLASYLPTNPAHPTPTPTPTMMSTAASLPYVYQDYMDHSTANLAGPSGGGNTVDLHGFTLTANEWAGIQGVPGFGEPLMNGLGPPSQYTFHPQNDMHGHGANGDLEQATRSLISANFAANFSAGGNVGGNYLLPARAWRPYEGARTSNEHIDPSLVALSNVNSQLSRAIDQLPGAAAALASYAHATDQAPESLHHNQNVASSSNANAAPTRKRPAPNAIQQPVTKRPRSHSQSQSHLPNSDDPPVSAPRPQAPASSTTAKPPLLTPAQKKANHILSEQKRRAKIRRGYDALCEVVPSLKAALLAEQDAGGGGSAIEATNTANKKKKAKSAKAPVDDGSKDGRAGPKSESVVLSQCQYTFRRRVSATCYSCGATVQLSITLKSFSPKRSSF